MVEIVCVLLGMRQGTSSVYGILMPSCEMEITHPNWSKIAYNQIDWTGFRLVCVFECISALKMLRVRQINTIAHIIRCSGCVIRSHCYAKYTHHIQIGLIVICRCIRWFLRFRWAQIHTHTHSHISMLNTPVPLCGAFRIRFDYYYTKRCFPLCFISFRSAQHSK